MLRTWRDVTEKWLLAPGRGCAAGRAALLDGRLDEAAREFRAALETRPDPDDEVGLGDVLLARGRWRAALARYRRAAETAPAGDPLPVLGTAQALVAGGDAAAAVTDLEHRYGATDDPVLRYYLASTWCSVAEQARDRTGDDVLVFTSAEQVALCDKAARRIIALDVPDPELSRGARRLLEEVAAARRWRWEPEGVAVSLAVLAPALGLLLVGVGGVTGNPALVVVGVVVGAGLLSVIVMRFRRQNWRVAAQRLGKPR